MHLKNNVLEEQWEYSGVTDLRQELLGIVERLQKNPAVRYLITKHGQPRAVLMSFQTYELLKKALSQALQATAGRSREEAIGAAFDRLRADRGSENMPATAAHRLVPSPDFREALHALRQDLKRLDGLLQEEEGEASGTLLVE